MYPSGKQPIEHGRKWRSIKFFAASGATYQHGPCMRITASRWTASQSVRNEAKTSLAMNVQLITQHHTFTAPSCKHRYLIFSVACHMSAWIWTPKLQHIKQGRCLSVILERSGRDLNPQDSAHLAILLTFCVFMATQTCLGLQNLWPSAQAWHKLT